MSRPANQRALLATIMVLAGGVLAATAGCTRKATALGVPCKGCNVVLLSIDTLRPDHLGLYGNTRPTSPELDRFFGEGAIFRNATSAAPCTMTSVKQILTGDYDGAALRLAEILAQEGGYTTAAVVSQHIFRWYGKMDDYARGFEHWDIQAPGELDHHKMSRRPAGEVTRRALAWLEGLDDDTDDRPFFLWLHYFDPHDPYEPPASFRRWPAPGTRYDDGDRRTYLRRARTSKDQPWHEAGSAFSEADVAHFVGLYDGEIAYTDAEVGKVLRRLERLSRPTVVVLVSDHGEHLGEGGLWDHCYSTQERELRVPLAFNLPPESFAAENLSTAAVSTLDVVPTLLDLLSIEDERSGIEGRSLRIADPHRRAVALFKDTVMIKEGRWKLVLHRDEGSGAFEPTGLYDVAADIGQADDRAGAHPERVTQLRADARSFFATIEARSEADRDVVEKLRALGYTE